MARCATVIMGPQDFGKLFQREAELQSSLCKLNPLDRRCWENPVTAIRALRGRLNRGNRPGFLTKGIGELDTQFVELGTYLCEVRAGQYWRVENLKSFDEFLERRFPESRRKAYYLMSIHEHLPPEVKRELKQVGWSKGLELAKLARRRDGQDFDCAIWLHKAREMSIDQFQREVDKELTGRETEPWEIIYFKLYKSQIPVIEQALETAALMLGSDKSRGYCLELICADFVAGANLDSAEPEVLLRAVARFFQFLPTEQKNEFLHQALGTAA
jgi:hypothetical protein